MCELQTSCQCCCNVSDSSCSDRHTTRKLHTLQADTMWNKTPLTACSRWEHCRVTPPHLCRKASEQRWFLFYFIDMELMFLLLFLLLLMKGTPSASPGFLIHQNLDFLHVPNFVWSWRLEQKRCHYFTEQDDEVEGEAGFCCWAGTRNCSGDFDVCWWRSDAFKGSRSLWNLNTPHLVWVF